MAGNLKNWYNYETNVGNTRKETFDLENEPSLTVPNQSISLRRIFDEFGAGLTIPTPEVLETPEVIDVLALEIDSMSKQDRIIFAAEAEKAIQIAEEKARSTTKYKAEFKKELEKAKEEWLKTQNKTETGETTEV